MAKAIEAKFLKGLTITVLEKRKVKGEEGEKIRQVAVERTLAPDDVLDWKDKGDAVVIVVADGAKHVVSKGGEETKKTKTAGNGKKGKKAGKKEKTSTTGNSKEATGAEKKEETPVADNKK